MFTFIIYFDSVAKMWYSKIFAVVMKTLRSVGMTNDNRLRVKQTKE